MRMEHPPMGPVQVMLSWGWSGKAQHSWTDRHSWIPWHSRTPARHIDHERALPVQSMYAWTGWYRRCSDVLKMLQGHTWPHGPKPQAGRRESENKGTGWGGDCNTSPPPLSPPVQGPLRVKSVADGGHHTSAAASPPWPWQRRERPSMPCPWRVTSLGDPLFSASQGQGMGCRTMHLRQPTPVGPSPDRWGWRCPSPCRALKGPTLVSHYA